MKEENNDKFESTSDLVINMIVFGNLLTNKEKLQALIDLDKVRKELMEKSFAYVRKQIESESK